VLGFHFFYTPKLRGGGGGGVDRFIPPLSTPPIPTGWVPEPAGTL